MAELKRTPLHPLYAKYGGKPIDFGGWELPVQYSGILEEHAAVRTNAGLFDVSHMGEFEVSGPDALANIQRWITNDAARLWVGQALYSPMCYPDGGTVDDLLVYRLAEQRYWLVVNAANIEKDFAWVKAHCEGEATLLNRSDEIAQLALQGPKAIRILSQLTEADLGSLPYYSFLQHIPVAGIECLVSRTGYTGEDGVEIYCQVEKAGELFEKLLGAGRPEGLVPVGLGARDTLRLEARLPLYGQELSEEISPLMAGIGMFVKLEKGDFIGREALARQKEQGVNRKIAGIEMVERGIPRTHYEVQHEGRRIGEVTSGTFSPTLKTNIGLALLDAPFAQIGTQVEVVIRNKPVQAKVVKTPFYKRER